MSEVVHRGKKIKVVKEFVPRDHGWEILPDKEQLSARIRGKFALDFKRLELYLSEPQKKSREGGNVLQSIDGDALYLDLKLNEVRVLPATVLDFFLGNQHHIPSSIPKHDEDGNAIHVCFWGSIFGTAEYNRGIRCMSWDNIVGKWIGDRRFFGEDFHKNYPALCVPAE